LNSADFQKGGFTTDESLEIIQLMEEAGVDLLEVSGGNYESAAMFGALSTQKREAYFLDFAKQARANLSKKNYNFSY
jgi:2,4-dienoyl-CoA reductase-like NADH-dependent reductase (Old Yellow Enzyme family)